MKKKQQHIFNVDEGEYIVGWLLPCSLHSPHSIAIMAMMMKMILVIHNSKQHHKKINTGWFFLCDSHKRLLFRLFIAFFSSFNLRNRKWAAVKTKKNQKTIISFKYGFVCCHLIFLSISIINGNNGKPHSHQT